MIGKPVKKSIDYLKFLLLSGLIVSLIFTITLFLKFDDLSVINDSAILDRIVKQSVGAIDMNENENSSYFKDTDEVNVNMKESKNAVFLNKCNSNIISSYKYDRNEKSLINDDFCDCPTGEDESETAACSYLLVGEKRFRCASKSNRYAENLHINKNEKRIETFPEITQYIFLSRVNDGTCDCLDGCSDEYLTGAHEKLQRLKKLSVDAKLNSVVGFLRRRRKKNDQ
jgi:hypothetical protein